MPLKEQRYKLHTGKKYLFYIYVDKTGRLAATTEVEPYIDVAEEGTFKVGDEMCIRDRSNPSKCNLKC